MQLKSLRIIVFIVSTFEHAVCVLLHPFCPPCVLWNPPKHPSPYPLVVTENHGKRHDEHLNTCRWHHRWHLQVDKMVNCIGRFWKGFGKIKTPIQIWPKRVFKTSLLFHIEQLRFWSNNVSHTTFYMYLYTIPWGCFFAQYPWRNSDKNNLIICSRLLGEWKSSGEPKFTSFCDKLLHWCE